MPRTGLWLRVFVGLLFAVLVPILLLVGALLLTESVLADLSPDLVALLVVFGAIAWAAILAIVYARVLSEGLRELLLLAERGDRGDEQDAGAAFQQLATALDERNRQVSMLARQSAQLAIDDEPRRVVAALVGAVRSVMGDATWRLAILVSEDPLLLPPGVHHASEDEASSASVGELERWASVALAGDPARRVDGPWGAFTVVSVSSTERLRGILYAPWEGRTDPSRAEMDLLTLVGQHAGTALEHSLLYSRVRSQADELTRLASLQADFLRGVTHDLQTPLTSIGALSTELRANPGIPAAARDDLESITHQADRLRRMVSQLLVASRLEAGALTPRQEVFAVPPLIDRTWNALRADRPFELVVEGAPHLAVADPDRLEQVLWALLDNAVKYSPAGSKIKVLVRPGEGGLLATVTDQGMGMDAATLERAFDQFYRSQGARKFAPDGSGVGLYAARGLMAAMGGSIEAASHLGSGTSITLLVPAEPAQAERD